MPSGECAKQFHEIHRAVLSVARSARCEVMVRVAPVGDPALLRHGKMARRQAQDPFAAVPRSINRPKHRVCRAGEAGPSFVAQ